MTHPLVLQLRFTRSEFQRALAGVQEGDAQRRFLPMNCISWVAGHMADQEQRYWFRLRQGKLLLPEIHTGFKYGAPASTPPLAAMQEAWSTITQAADPWLDTLTSDLLQERHQPHAGGPDDFFTFGSLMQRVIYHYWYHTGEIMSIRQLLGHANLPEFVGNIDDEAPYLPE